MPIGKARQLLRGRKAAEVPPHDPHDTEAYESGWYALLVQHGAERGETNEGEDPGASEAGDVDADETEIGAGEAAPTTPGSDPGEEPEDAGPTSPEEAAGPPSPEEAAAARLAEVTILALRAQASDGPWAGDRIMRPRTGEPQAGDGALVDRITRSRSDPASIRIGVRRVEDPTRVYLDYLTASRHRDYFRADWWPSSGPITPVHLWRANHIGAGWDVESIGRFMSDASVLAGELIASAPRSAAAGSPERRAWQTRFVSAGWVREFGIGRVSKTLHPMLPELVADLDPAMMAWARRSWFGLDEHRDAEDPELWLEIVELLEDVLVLRSQPLGQIARRLRRSAQGIAPVSRLGPVLAAFWEGYWEATLTPVQAEVLGVPPLESHARPAAQPDEPPEADGGAPDAASPPGSAADPQARPPARAKRSSGSSRSRTKSGGATPSRRPRTRRPTVTT